MAYIFIVFVLIPVFVILNGYVFQQLWSWFIVPFIGLPSLSLTAAIGVAIAVGYVTHQYNPSNNEGKTPLEIASCAITHLTTKPLAALLVGWIVTLFM